MVWLGDGFQFQHTMSVRLWYIETFRIFSIVFSFLWIMLLLFRLLLFLIILRRLWKLIRFSQSLFESFEFWIVRINAHVFFLTTIHSNHFQRSETFLAHREICRKFVFHLLLLMFHTLCWSTIWIQHFLTQSVFKFFTDYLHAFIQIFLMEDIEIILEHFWSEFLRKIFKEAWLYFFLNKVDQNLMLVHGLVQMDIIDTLFVIFCFLQKLVNQIVNDFVYLANGKFFLHYCLFSCHVELPELIYEFIHVCSTIICKWNSTNNTVRANELIQIYIFRILNYFTHLRFWLRLILNILSFLLALWIFFLTLQFLFLFIFFILRFVYFHWLLV